MLQDIRGPNSFVDCRIEDIIKPKLLILLAKIYGVLIVTLCMQHWEKDKEEHFLYTNQGAKAVVGDFVKRSISLRQYAVTS